MKYSGIDLHSNNSVVVVSDEVDRVLVRRRVPNDVAAILALLGASMNARRRGPTASSPPRRWRTNWRAPATTCSRRTSRST